MEEGKGKAVTCNVSDGEKITNDPMTTMRGELLIQHTKQTGGFLGVALGAIGLGMLWSLVCVIDERKGEKKREERRRERRGEERVVVIRECRYATK